MPSTYWYKGFNFIKVGDDGCGTYFYNIIHPSGRYWDYNHPFKSVSDMEYYVDMQ